MIRTLRNLICCSALTSVALLASAQQNNAVGGIGIAPLIHRVHGAAGRTIEVKFGLINPTQLASIAEASLLPSTFVDGSYARKDEQHDRDLTQFAVTKSFNTRLNPGQTGELKIRFKLPMNASGVYWTVLSFRPRPVNSNAGVMLNYEIPIIVMVGRQLKAEVKISTPALEGDKAFVVKVPVANDGAGYTPAGVSGEVRSVTGGVVKSFGIPDRNLFPNSSRVFSFPVGQLPDGKYRVSASVELGSRRLPAMRTEVTISGGKPKATSNTQRLELTPVVASPAGISLPLPAGGTKTEVVKFTNLSKRTLTLDVGGTAVSVTEDGLLGITDGPLPKGLQISASPAKVTIAPGRSSSVRVRIRTTKEAAGDLWFGVSYGESAGKSVPEFLVGNVLVGKSLTAKLKLGLEKLDVVNGRPVGARFWVRNDGNLAVKPIPTGNVLAGGVKNAGLIEVPVLGMGGLLPGTKISNIVSFPPTLKPGKYVAVVQYSLNDPSPATLKIPFEIPAQRNTASKSHTPKKVASKTPAKKPVSSTTKKGGKA